MTNPTRTRIPLPRRIRPLAGLAAAGLLAVTGCSATSTGAENSAAPADAVIDNCGTEVDTAAAPERIVTIKSTSTELLIALGLADRVIGSAFQDGPVPEEWAAAAADIPVISDFAPSQEAVLELEPDFVFAGWESMLTAEAAGDRASLAGLGIGTYVAPSACKESGYQPEKLTFDEVFAQIAEAGRVFHAQEAAADLVAEQRSALEAIESDDRGMSALWYSSGTDTPYVGAGIGAPQMMMERLGLTNVAADVADTWSPLGWEAIIDADPDVIVLVDASWNTAASKIELLESNPATAALGAVQSSRYLVVPFAAGEAGVRNVSATANLAQQLAAVDVE
ncbi:putative F420-0 ABC transporter substrate-binding protein [Marisediminicola antarctica]|uniref:Putative F420-0 ABC transporter substrate-binding protein n=1 Tax=Marisediminicola antarctica TaxID=674079 RepID=A0A7L5ANL1_9MICO|nr:putative F420-0 ABC transporter substrate-binding protein [Marisediminicola antarctica]QHO70701.1 putative F420-0 ABC transporter substrate-binding protein [Marisediminicola antarctica]